MFQISLEEIHQTHADLVAVREQDSLGRQVRRARRAASPTARRISWRSVTAKLVRVRSFAQPSVS